MTDKLLTQERAAELLGIAARTLADWRRKGTGPAYVKLGHRTIRYDRAALERFLVARTSEAGS